MSINDKNFKINKNLLIKTRRLYIDSEIAIGVPIIQIDLHYIKKVIKLKEKEYIRVFNKEKEFLCILQKNNLIPEQLVKQNIAKNKFKLSLACAILKPNSMSESISSVAQFNLYAIYPIITDRVQIKNINLDRYKNIILSSTQQSEKLNLIEMNKISDLEKFLTEKSKIANLICCDEAFYYKNNENIVNICNSNIDALKDDIKSTPNITYAKSNDNQENCINIFSLKEQLQKLDFSKEFIILIGPEGGFTEHESFMISKYSPIYLNFASILRAETCAISAIVLIEQILLSI